MVVIIIKYDDNGDKKYIEHEGGHISNIKLSSNKS